MSTRGFIGIVIDDTEKITYNHSDSYPSWLGVQMLETARTIADDPTKYRELARALVLIDEETTPTLEQQAALKQYANTSVSTGRLDEWYVLLRNIQGNLLKYLEAGYMPDGAGFPVESLFCEWGYLIDFDNDRFEVYKGFRRTPTTEGRWAGRPNDEDKAADVADLEELRKAQAGDARLDDAYWDKRVDEAKNPRYFAVQRVASWPLSALPQDELEITSLEAHEDAE